ncbi:MAG: SDR family NAD(P)-dependent oxidoreductase [Pseudochelatococcus sp.]|jgi:NAD(P)-dependent dehydrogenase (short-subunit alcohol dehydrogenase family)|uniref:SDR family NAD(P)-dependent oxidoreductase n=1 Tax=Pseudochelatococcus sp. TaxID=2020869 RepID=UPI003D8CD86B
MNDIKLAGQIAVVSGGTGGIGLATVDRLRASGAKVVLWDIDEGALEAAASARPDIEARKVDLLQEDEVGAAARAVAERYGRLDILVNCVGLEGKRSALAEHDLALWRRLIDINLTASFISCKHAVREMLRNDYGRIVNLTSTAGKDGNALDAAYSSAKAGIMGFTKSVGKELATTGIRVNCVCPAAIDSPLFDRLPPEQKAFSISKIPVGRLGRMDEVAGMIAWLCSTECSFSTGATFDVSGGRSTY